MITMETEYGIVLAVQPSCFEQVSPAFRCNGRLRNIRSSPRSMCHGQKFTLDRVASAPTGTCAAILTIDKIAHIHTQCTGHSLAFCTITLPYKDFILTIVSKQLFQKKFSTKSTFCSAISWVLPVGQRASYEI